MVAQNHPQCVLIVTLKNINNIETKTGFFFVPSVIMYFIKKEKKSTVITLIEF